VAEALRRGERPDLATTMASGPLDELVALHQALGIFAIVDELEVQRTRAGIDDELLVRTLATLPFVEHASLSGGSSVLFREPAVLLHLGWAPVQIRQGSHGRHRHPEGRREESLPCHPDTDAATRCDVSGSLPGCARKKQESKRSISDSSCEAKSMPSMAAAWATISV
jgi:predicted RNA binding protein YcfA (HicA-like mRNA interferase family)